MAIEYPVGALTAALSSAKSKKRNADSNIDDDKKISLAKLFTTSNNYTEVCYQPLTTFTPSIAKKRSRKRKARDDNEIEEITVASIIMRNQQVLKDSDGKKSPQNNHTKRETKIKESGLERSSSSKKVNKHSTFKDNVEKESQTNTNKHQWNKDANEKMGIIKKKKRKPITEVSNEDHKEASVTKITNKQHLRWDEDAETNNDGSLISDPPEENVLETQSKKRRIREYDDESELLEQPVAEESDEEQVNSKKSKHSKPRGLEDPEETTRTVFVGNLPVSVELKRLRNMFKVFGKVEAVRLRSLAPADPQVPKRVAVIKRDVHPQRHNINAYVRFAEKSSVRKALKLNGTNFDGFVLRVDKAGRRKRNKKNCVFLGNLAFDIEENEIHSHFEDCGPIKNVRLIRDAVTGVGKGFGFVEFENRESVELALRMNDSTLSSKTLRVKRCTNGANKVKNTEKRKKFGGLKSRDEMQKNVGPSIPKRKTRRKSGDADKTMKKRKKKLKWKPTKI